MTWSIGIHLGESVLEIVARNAGDDESAQLLRSRSVMSQGALEQPLSQFIAQNDIKTVDKVHIASPLPLNIIEAGHGTSIAFLTTAGFENWLEFSLPLKTDFFTSRPERTPFYFDRELFFGLRERTNSQGHIEKLIDENEMEFLCSKLQLHNIKNLAIGFLHSHLNPENERRAKQFFESRGFKVFLSSVQPVGGEQARFWSALGNAYVSPLFVERLTSLRKCFENCVTAETKFIIGEFDLDDVLTGEVAPLQTAFSFSDYLAENFAKTHPFLYCGLEEFLLFDPQVPRHDIWSSNVGKFAAPHAAYTKPEIQPLTKLGRCFFSDLTYIPERITYDPGPVVMGRGLAPTLFDLLVLSDDVPHLLGITEKMNDRGRMRLKETLAAYARTFSEGTHVSADDLAQHLLNMAAESWRHELGHLEDLTICGPLAPLVKKYISGHVTGDEFFCSNSLLLKGRS